MMGEMERGCEREGKGVRWYKYVGKSGWGWNGMRWKDVGVENEEWKLELELEKVIINVILQWYVYMIIG